MRTVQVPHQAGRKAAEQRLGAASEKFIQHIAEILPDTMGESWSTDETISPL